MLNNTLKAFAPVLALAVIGGNLVGCDNIGKAPAGASQEEMKTAFDKLPLEERAKMLLDRPGPMDDKKKSITAMYEKEGKEPPADMFGAPAAGAPGSTTGDQGKAAPTPAPATK